MISLVMRAWVVLLQAVVLEVVCPWMISFLNLATSLVVISEDSVVLVDSAAEVGVVAGLTVDLISA